MLDFHSLKKSWNLRHHLKIILEQISLKHSIKILRNLLTLMKTTLQIITNLRNIRHMSILIPLIVISIELEIHLLSEEIFQKEVHHLLVLLLLEILVREHCHTTADYQLTPAFLVLVHRTYRPVAWVCQRTWSQNSIRWIFDCQRCTIDVNKVNTCTFWFLLILLLIIISCSSHHECVMLTSFWLFGVSIDNSSHLLIENSIVNVRLFGVEIFVKRCSDNTVRVDSHSKFTNHLVDIRIILPITSLVRKDQQIASILNILLEVLNLSGSKFILRSSKNKKMSFFNLIEIDGILIESNLL